MVKGARKRASARNTKTTKTGDPCGCGGGGHGPDLGSGSFPCTREPRGHPIFQTGDDNEKEVAVFVSPCPGGSVDVVGGKPKPKPGNPNPQPAERITADSPQTVVVRGVTVGITCKGEKGECTYRIVQIK